MRKYSEGGFYRKIWSFLHRKKGETKIFTKSKNVKIPFTPDLRRFEEALPQEGYQLRVTLTLAAMTVVFLACWWPYGVIFMMEHSGDKGIILWNVVTLAYSNREECSPHLSSLQIKTNS